MYEVNQIVIPDSFVALFLDVGRTKPRESREFIAARYEFCEDLSCMLIEHAQTQLFQLGVTEADVLGRVHAGLLVAESGVSAMEANWVIRRLAELLEWPWHGGPACTSFEGP